MIIDPEKAPLIRKIFEAYGSGNYTLSGLRKGYGTSWFKKSYWKRALHFQLSISFSKIPSIMD